MNKERPAYSLIFAFIMMTLIMVISSTSIQDTRNKLALFRDLEANSQARLAAESAAELGIVDLKASKFTSERASSDVFCLQEDSTSDCYSDSTYTIYPYAKTNTTEGDGYYYLPIPGTGDAAPSEDCSIDNPQESGHACNWNKLSPGNPISIPLHYDDGTGVYSLPMNTGFTNWVLKVRTPCKGGDITADCDDSGSGSAGDRYRFDHNDSPSDDSDGDGNLYDENSVVVFWELAGYDSSESQVISVIPDDCYGFSFTSYMNTKDACATNTEIHEVQINNELDSGDYKMLSTDDFSAIHTDLSYSSVETMYLNLSIINNLTDEDGDQIPHLEYQFYIDSTNPTISPISSVVGEGYYESGEFTYYFPYSVSYSSSSESTTLYTLSN